jgi:Tfp pilus assembly protein PilO
MKDQLYKHRHLAIPFGIPALLLLILYWTVISSQLGAMEDLRFQYNEFQNTWEKHHAYLKKEKMFQKDLEKAKEILGKYDSLVRGMGAGEEMVSAILGCAKACGVKIAGMEAGKAVPGEMFQELSLKVKLEGSFANELKFIRALESKQPPFKIEGLGMHPDSKGYLQAGFTVKALVKNTETQRPQREGTEITEKSESKVNRLK